MSKYPLIADHGLIGNLQTAALVSTDGTIDWFGNSTTRPGRSGRWRRRAARIGPW
jgi:hypothetical protein